MKRGHVPRRAAQVANFSLFLVIVGVCGFLTWRASQLQVFVVPEDYIAGYVEEDGFLWKKEQVRVFSAGDHPVLHNEEAASSLAYRVEKKAFAFDTSAPVNVALWKDAKNLLTRSQAPILRVHGVLEASVTKQTVEACLLSDTSIDHAMQDAIARGLAKSVREDGVSKAALEKALLDDLEPRLTGQIHLKVDAIRIDEIAEVDLTTPTTIGLPSDFVVQTRIVNRTPPAAYASVGLALLVGALVFVAMRLIFADLLALIILTPFQWVGLVEEIHWRLPEKEDMEEAVASGCSDVVSAVHSFSSGSGSGAPTSESGPVAGPTIDGESLSNVTNGWVEGLSVDVVPGELASGAAEATAEALVGGMGDVAGGLAEGALGGCAEGCLGGIFG